MMVLELLVLLLGIIEHFYQLVVLKDGDGVVGNLVENSLLQLSFFSLVFSLLDDGRLHLLILLLILELDDNLKHLILKSFLSGLEVKHGDIDTNFWGVVRSGDLGGDVESELLVVWDDLLSESDVQLATLLFQVFGKEWFQEGIESLKCIFQDDWDTMLYRDLKGSGEVSSIHSWLNHLQIVLSLHSLDPSVGLHLWVNHEWPSIGVFHDDGVVSGECISWQLVNLPLSDLNRIT